MQGVTIRDVIIQNITTQAVRIQCVPIHSDSIQVSQYRYHNTGVKIDVTMPGVTIQIVTIQFIKYGVSQYRMLQHKSSQNIVS